MSQDLARRAVASKHWRWLPGMLAIHPNFRDVRVSHVGRTGMHGACRYASPMGGVSQAVVALPLPTSSDVLPDLTDSATLGCLLALVREAWGDPTIGAVQAGDYKTAVAGLTIPSRSHWLVMRAGAVGLDVHKHGDTEAEALVAALEAAP